MFAYVEYNTLDVLGYVFVAVTVLLDNPFVASACVCCPFLLAYLCGWWSALNLIARPITGITTGCETAKRGPGQTTNHRPSQTV